MGNLIDKPAVLDRIKGYYSLKGNAELARFLGVAPNTITNWYSRKTFDLDVIYTKCVDINIDWLLTGEGSMLRHASKPDPEVVAHPAQGVGEGIPLIPISAMAGAFSGDQQVMEYECERYVVPAFKGADFLISVKGSSMYPKYNSGDIVACKRLAMSDLFFQWNKVYVLDTDQGPLIKRVKPGSDKEHVTIVSDNERYEPFELSLDHIYNVALVIGVIRLE